MGGTLVYWSAFWILGQAILAQLLDPNHWARHIVPHSTIVNAGKWLWNLAKFFVVGFLDLIHGPCNVNLDLFVCCFDVYQDSKPVTSITYDSTQVYKWNCKVVGQQDKILGRESWGLGCLWQTGSPSRSSSLWENWQMLKMIFCKRQLAKNIVTSLCSWAAESTQHVTYNVASLPVGLTLL